MKKSAFTLSELLITLSIIGIAAVLIMPTVVNIMPDKNKLKVLNYYAQISNAINDVLSNPDIYHPYTTTVTDEANNTTLILTQNGTDPCAGMSCIEDTVLRREFLTRLKIEQYTDENNDTFLRFQDGSYINIVFPDSWDDNNSVLEISIELKGENSSSCTSNKAFSGECTENNIDTFTFEIDKLGGVTTKDFLTKVYLKNPTKMHDKTNDLSKARAMYKKNKLNDNENDN